jgi:hypothetical protein
MFENNIFTNSVGWAKSAVGKNWQYLLMVVGQVFLASLSIVFYSIMAVKFNVPVMGPVIVIFFSALVLPLCYLKALRGLVQKQLDNNTK